MSMSTLFIVRPVATTLLMVALVIFGILAFLRLPVSALPNVDFPTISVSAALPGAGAETMAAAVATPLEREFSTIDGIDSMISSSSFGSTQLTLQFAASKSLDTAAQDVQAAIARAANRLPREMPSPPTYRKVNPAEQPVLYIALSSPLLRLFELNALADNRLAPQISTIPGVAQVQIFGAQKFAVRIQADPDALAARGLALDDVVEAVQKGNVNQPTGTVYTENKAFTVRTNGALFDAADFAELVVGVHDGAPVRLRDVAAVVDGVENDKIVSWIYHHGQRDRSLVVAVQKQPGANTVEVSQAVRDLLPDFMRELPASVEVEIVFDRSVSVKHSVADVEYTLVLTLFLVALVIFAFLRKMSATLIPSLAMPLSLLGTFAVMHLAGFSLNNLTLMALTLSVGFVVDDAIVMLENVVRHLEMGKKPLQAAIDGAAEIGFTILSMTLSLVAVFLPFLFMGGLLGRLFTEFSVTIALAILFSGVVSLTLTPMLAARFISSSPEREANPTWLKRKAQASYDAVVDYYSVLLAATLRRPMATLAFSLLILLASVFFFVTIPKGFLPTEDENQLLVSTEGIEGISFDAMREHQLALGDIVARHPQVRGFTSGAGARGSGASNTGYMFVRLTPRGERSQTIASIANDLRSELAQIVGIRAFVQVPPPIRISGHLTKSEFQMVVQGSDTEALYAVAPQLAAEMAKLPMLRDVTTDLQLKNTEIKVQVDRERAAQLGLSQQDIEDTLLSAYGPRRISTIYAADNSYDVYLEISPEISRDLQNFSRLPIRASSGALVPLSEVAQIEIGVGPLSVNHYGQMPSVTVSFNLNAGYGLSQAVQAVEEVAEKLLPVGVSTHFEGAAEAFQESLQGLAMLLAVSIFVIYVVLGILYESFIHPITILSALPFAGFGALAALLVCGVELNVYAFVGVILLVGLVKKNGIMMIDFAIDQQAQGASAHDAIHRACVVRFRPIMMTTMAALLGTLPIALGLGAGAESRQPLGIAVVGGLLFSQVLTLFVTPVFFVVLENLKARFYRH
jgi:HAE1 family hydrophobic/amphiphilic exporter-1